MTIAWHKLGRVYCAAGEFPWAISHAYCPTPVLLDGGARVRVLCAFLDASRVGRCGWVNVDSRRPDHVIAVSDRPVLD
ncbi:MAG: glucosyl hydrolase, partial [Actinomycetota bacterium]|nr:glucosyl hydrolase [Actinomycetota bacterium]